MRSSRMFLGALAGALALLSPGCATSGHVQRNYEKDALEAGRVLPGERTVVLFLVDGLGEAALKSALAANDIPNLRRHFLAQPGARVERAKTVFSSATFPGIVSLLTTSPVSRHGVLSNRVLEIAEGKLQETNFESVFERDSLRRRFGPISVFSRLSARGEGSVSLSEPFGTGATAAYPRRFVDGIYYANHAYSGIDDQILQSLEKLLARTPTRAWPAFIFVHLIGYDALAHDEGFDSRAARRYLARLDKRLGETLARLRHAERGGRAVVSLLTADHGFMNRGRFVNAKRALKRIAPNADTLVEGRIAQLRFPGASRGRSHAPLLKALVGQDGIGLAAARDGESVYVVRRGAAERIDFLPGNCGAYRYQIRVVDLERGSPRFFRDFACPEEFDRFELERDAGYAYSSLADFFRADTSPDVVVVAAPGVAFTSGARGQHGGLTREEMIVPLLTRNASLGASDRLFSTIGLLEFLFSGPTRQSLAIRRP